MSWVLKGVGDLKRSWVFKKGVGREYIYGSLRTEKLFSVKSRVTTYARKNAVDPDPG